MPDASTGGSSYTSLLSKWGLTPAPSPAPSNSSSFYPDAILRTAAANGTINTAAVDGSAHWLDQLPAIGSAVSQIIGATKSTQVGTPAATPASFAPGGSVAGIPMPILLIGGAVGLYLMVKH